MAEKTKEELSRLLAQHCDDLQRYAAGLSEDAVAEFAETEAAIYELIYQIEATLGGNMKNDYQTQRKLDALKEQLEEIRNSVKDDLCEELDGETADLIETESNFLLLMLAAWLAASGRKGRDLSKADAEKIARYGKYKGLTREQIIDKVTAGDINRIYEEIVDGLKNGDSLAELREAARKEMMTTRRYIKSEVESIVNGVVNDVGLAMAGKNHMALIYLTMFDFRVCDECRNYNGKIYEYDSENIPALPRHIHCRCRLVPAAGLSTDEMTISFPEYFESLSATEKRKRLGNKKYEQYKSGEYKIKPYEEPPASARMSLEEIRKRDSDAFA